MSDVAAAVHCRCDLAVALLSGVHWLAELDLGHCQENHGGFNGRIQCDKGSHHVSLVVWAEFYLADWVFLKKQNQMT